MFWNLGAHEYDDSWPSVIAAEVAAVRLRDMHYSTLSLMHGFAALDGYADGKHAAQNETITRWTRQPLDVNRLRTDRVAISPAYAAANHSGFEFVRDHLGYRLELQWADFPHQISRGATLNFSAGLVNWGFAAPVNPRPVLLVLLSPGSAGAIAWRSDSLADVTDWQPHQPGDPTYSAVEHVLVADEKLPLTVPPGEDYRLGILMPDARMENLADTEEMAAAFSIRLANDDVPWVALRGVGAVNVLGRVAVKGDDEASAPTGPFIGVFRDYDPDNQYTWANTVMYSSPEPLLRARQKFGMRGFVSLEDLGTIWRYLDPMNKDNRSGLLPGWQEHLTSAIDAAGPFLRNGTVLGM